MPKKWLIPLNNTLVADDCIRFRNDQRIRFVALHEECVRQWHANHDEHCTNQWPHDGICYWPWPEVLNIVG